MNGGDMPSDPAIKLFGRTIPLPDSLLPASSVSEIPAHSENMEGGSEVAEEETENFSASDSSRKTHKSPSPEDDDDDCQILPQNASNPKEGSIQNQNQSDDNGGGGGGEKALKKPDKILPCPRCRSTDTKFCYFNNYNVNQPRHFCKNCQRYWTAGGTTRNVPVGAGRRKNKQLASQYRQIILTANAIPAFGVDPSSDPSFLASSSSHQNGAVLKFGPDTPFSQNVATVLNLAGQRSSAEAAFSSQTNGSNFMHKNGVGAPGTGIGFGQQQAMNYYPVPHPSLVVPMNSGPNCSNPNAMQWCSPQMVAVPGYCGAPSIPLQFVAAPSYWGCMPMWPAGTGNVPMAAPGSNGYASTANSPSNGFLNSTSNSFSPGMGSSLALGKHSRGVNLFGGGESNRNGYSRPKSGGSNDGTEASWSSIWSALAVNLNQQKESSSSGGARGSVITSEVLQSNLVAYSRSPAFEERI